MFLKANWKPQAKTPVLQAGAGLEESQRIVEAVAAKGSFVIVKGAQLYSGPAQGAT